MTGEVVHVPPHVHECRPPRTIGTYMLTPPPMPFCSEQKPRKPIEMAKAPDLGTVWACDCGKTWIYVKAFPQVRGRIGIQGEWVREGWFHRWRRTRGRT